ncbi:MAG: histidine--tRNA ligase [Bacteroidales bacterium]
MTPTKPSIPKGTRDFGTTEMVRRNYIFDTIRSVFQRYGFKPIETPAMENLSTLLGKYGEEEDKLIYEITNSHTQKIIEDLKNSNKGKSQQQTEVVNGLLKLIYDSFDKGLRYDLTVPFARYVVMHQNEIIFPFKRYQIQPVWRADRPQKGRYREFYQCDVDVIGSDSLLNEVELIQIVDTIFNELKIAVNIKLNNRKILSGISEVIGEAEKIVDITVAIDKLDKIGIVAVRNELVHKGISRDAILKLQPIIELTGNSEQKLKVLKETLEESSIGLKGISEVETIFEYLRSIEIKSPVELDITLARGLNYYTGAIFEVKAKDAAMGSIAGGGRYDDLTGIFGLPNVSGVGISFGADRIYDAMQDLKLFPENSGITTQLFFVNFGPNEEKYCLPLVAEARRSGINTELYPNAAKMKKQLDYANANNIPFVAIVGSDEMNAGFITLKNMCSGEQLKKNLQELVDFINSQK